MWSGRASTVSDDGSVDDGCEQLQLVLAGVVHEQRGGVLVAEGHVLRGNGADRTSDGEGLEKHSCGILLISRW